MPQLPTDVGLYLVQSKKSAMIAVHSAANFAKKEIHFESTLTA